MYTNIEFLDTEQIENVITALHHKIDKTIFIGYEDTIAALKNRTGDFLRDYCGVKEVEYKAVSKSDLYDVLQKLRQVVETEKASGNQVFFDITGGEGLILVAFGMLAGEYSLPIHQYDVVTDEIHEMNPQDVKPISAYTEIQKEKVKLDLDTYIRMQGATISKKKLPGAMDTDDAIFMKKVKGLWSVLCDYKEKWNFYAEVLGSVFKTDDLYADAILDSTRVYDIEEFKEYLERIEQTKAIYKLRVTTMPEEKGVKSMRISFFYDSEDMKSCLIKGGNTLELHTYQVAKKNSCDCRQSVMIDWDGVEHAKRGADVLNEIDVISITGNVPTFISCKGGRMDDGQALQPLYELETVATRFGGKYAKKVLATVHPLQGVYAERAKEMGIILNVATKEG